MSDWTIWAGLVLVAILTLFSTLNLALRLPLRVRLAERFESSGKTAAFEAFAAARQRYILGTAILRCASMLLLLATGLVYLEAADPTPGAIPRVVTIVVVLLVVLVFGVAIPDAWARYAGETLILRMLPVLAGVRVILSPLIGVLAAFDPLIRRLAGIPVQNARSYADALEEEILQMISEGQRHGAVDEEEREMIESVIELAETRVDEIMTPRTEIVAVPETAGLEAVLNTIRDKGHSRIPVYRSTIDTILGILYAKDLLQRGRSVDFRATEVMRKALFIPESKLVRELLHEFQDRKVHIAVVLDEYGGTAGLVTIEDILEELVGEITDEYDAGDEAEIKRIDDRTVEVDARMRIDDLNDQLRLELPEDEDYETLGGFVFSRLGRIPRVGERVELDNVVVRVVAAEPRRITRLRLEMLPAEQNNRATA